MFSLLRNRFGIPGVISVIALVFAMLGGAYAANYSGGGDGKATASAKAKKGPRGPKGPKGDTGPAGPAGPQGPAGANGANGAKGANGQVGPTGPAGEDGADGTPGVQGPQGNPWTAGGTLPTGSTQTGLWSVGEASLEFVGALYLSQISFPIPLAAPLPGSNVHYIEAAASPTIPAECNNGQGAAPSYKNPEADPGHLCVFGGFEFLSSPGSNVLIGDLDSNSGAATSGALLLVETSTGGNYYGSFAVTGG